MMFIVEIKKGRSSAATITLFRNMHRRSQYDVMSEGSTNHLSGVSNSGVMSEV
jgi:hypothetical protein